MMLSNRLSTEACNCTVIVYLCVSFHDTFLYLSLAILFHLILLLFLTFLVFLLLCDFLSFDPDLAVSIYFLL